MSSWNLGFLAASALSAAGLLIHLIGGGRSLGRPLLASNLAPPVRGLLWLCLHLVSLMNLTLALVFWWAAVNFQGRAAATAMTGFALSASLLAGLAAIRTGSGRSGLVPAVLYLAIFAAGFWGCYGSFWDMIAG